MLHHDALSTSHGPLATVVPCTPTIRAMLMSDSEANEMRFRRLRMTGWRQLQTDETTTIRKTSLSDNAENMIAKNKIYKLLAYVGIFRLTLVLFSCNILILTWYYLIKTSHASSRDYKFG